jgi:hypothetical protein
VCVCVCVLKGARIITMMIIWVCTAASFHSLVSQTLSRPQTKYPLPRLPLFFTLTLSLSFMWVCWSFFFTDGFLLDCCYFETMWIYPLWNVQVENFEFLGEAPARERRRLEVVQEDRCRKAARYFFLFLQSMISIADCFLKWFVWS